MPCKKCRYLLIYLEEAELTTSGALSETMEINRNCYVVAFSCGGQSSEPGTIGSNGWSKFSLRTPMTHPLIRLAQFRIGIARISWFDSDKNIIRFTILPLVLQIFKLSYRCFF